MGLVSNKSVLKEVYEIVTNVKQNTNLHRKGLKGTWSR